MLHLEIIFHRFAHYLHEVKGIVGQVWFVENHQIVLPG